MAEERPEIRGPAAFKGLFIASLVALVVLLGFIFLALFEPPLPYAVSRTQRNGNGSPEFLRTLHALTGGWLDMSSRVEALIDGASFYPAQLEAIRSAQKSVHLEAYMFEEGRVGAEFIKALAERARAGVEVRIVIDAVGSSGAKSRVFEPVTSAGGELARYHPLKWYTWPRLNNRTHRELLIVDGRIGFIGGAGIADQWRYDSKDRPRWRDMAARVTGDAVAGLQSAFAENWLEAAGEVLADPEYFPAAAPAGDSPSLVVASSPTAGRSTPARVLFQTLIASAAERIHINSPYFLPDRSLRDEIARAAGQRKVKVKIVMPGPKIDHPMVRSSSRRLWGDLLEAGVEIYEYEPSMNHTKRFTVDGLWAVIGSTNMDGRSFALNDEVNLAVRDAAFVKTLDEDFLADVAKSSRVDYQRWKRRKLRERIEEWIGSLVERQQ